MIKLITDKKRNMNESLYAPYEGIFWLIDDKLVSFIEQVDTTGRFSTTLEHIKIWEEIKGKYRVDNNTVSYDFFPRGRVMVNPKYKDETFTHYEVFVYLDDCINKSNIIDEIFYEFNLNQLICVIKYVGSEGGITDNHYTCHNCRK